MLAKDTCFGHSAAHAPVLVQLPKPNSSILATIALARAAASTLPCGKRANWLTLAETNNIAEPWRSRAFPVIKDLMVDRDAYDKIMQAGGFVSVNTGGIPDANAIPIPKAHADEAMDAASCIGCGACAAACKNGSAMLFVSAKVSQLALLPQGKVEAAARAKAMVAKMDELGFGNCTNTGACAAECPKQVSLANIARLNREFLCAKFQD